VGSKIEKLIFVVIVILLTACSKEPIHNQVLEKAIVMELKQEGTTEIQLGEHTNFSWDKAFFFTPYTSNERIQEQLEKSDIHSNFENRIEYLDSYNLIVFVQKGEVIQYAEIPRTYGDFMLKKGNIFTPENDLVQIQLHNK
jgi:hypothetical protein